MSPADTAEPPPFPPAGAEGALGPSPDTLVYTVKAGGENDGVYVRWFAD